MQNIRVDAPGARPSRKLIQEAFEQDFVLNRRVPMIIVTTHEIHRIIVEQLPNRVLGALFFQVDGKSVGMDLRPGSCVEVNGVPTFASERVPVGCIYMGAMWDPGVVDSPPLDKMHVIIHNVSTEI